MIKTKLKYKTFRLLIRWRKWKQSFGDKMIPDSQVTPYEEKAMKLWKILIKDENTKLSFNTLGVRQIEKSNILLILQPGYNSDSIMTLMDVTSDRRNLCELRIPSKYAEEVCDYFDYELERRMKKSENNKRAIIEKDIDILLEQEEKRIAEKFKK